MLLDAKNLQAVFARGCSYADYLACGTDDQRDRWRRVYDTLGLTEDQTQLLGNFTRRMNVLLVSGIWCGDCVVQGPMAARIAEACPQIQLRYIDRDDAPELRDEITLCAGQRVPFAIFMAEDFAFCSLFGDRTLTRYRAIAQQQLGAACSTGLFVPDGRELADTLEDWLNEFERVQLMLRLSTRLRQKHGD